MARERTFKTTNTIEVNTDSAEREVKDLTEALEGVEEQNDRNARAARAAAEAQEQAARTAARAAQAITGRTAAGFETLPTQTALTEDPATVRRAAQADSVNARAERNIERLANANRKLEAALDATRKEAAEASAQINQMNRAAASAGTRIEALENKTRELADSVRTLSRDLAQQRGETARATRQLEALRRAGGGGGGGIFAPLSAGARDAGRAAGFLRSELAQLLSVYAAFSVVRTLTSALLENAKAYERVRAQLSVVTGEIGVSQDALLRLNLTARELGVTQLDLASQFSRFAIAARGTSLEGAQTEAIFRSTAKAAAALRLEGAGVARTFRALEQMVSKGKVSMEELRQQLGDQIPGAFSLFARAARDAGIAETAAEFDKLVAQGKVTTEILPFVAQEFERTFGAAAQQAAQGLNGRINNLRNSYDDFLQAANRAGGTAVFAELAKRTADALDRISDSLKDTQIDAVAFVDSVQEGVERLGQGVAVLLGIRAVLALRTLAGAFTVTATAVTALASGFGVAEDGGSSLVGTLLKAATALGGLAVLRGVVIQFNMFRNALIAARLQADMMGVSASRLRTTLTALGPALAGLRALGGVLAVTSVGVLALSDSLDTYSDSTQRVARVTQNTIETLSAIEVGELRSRIEADLSSTEQRLAQAEARSAAAVAALEDAQNRVGRGRNRGAGLGDLKAEAQAAAADVRVLGFEVNTLKENLKDVTFNLDLRTALADLDELRGSVVRISEGLSGPVAELTDELLPDEAKLRQLEATTDSTLQFIARVQVQQAQAAALERELAAELSKALDQRSLQRESFLQDQLSAINRNAGIAERLVGALGVDRNLLRVGAEAVNQIIAAQRELAKIDREIADLQARAASGGSGATEARRLAKEAQDRRLEAQANLNRIQRETDAALAEAAGDQVSAAITRQRTIAKDGGKAAERELQTATNRIREALASAERSLAKDRARLDDVIAGKFGERQDVNTELADQFLAGLGIDVSKVPELRDMADALRQIAAARDDIAESTAQAKLVADLGRFENERADAAAKVAVSLGVQTTRLREGELAAQRLEIITEGEEAKRAKIAQLVTEGLTDVELMAQAQARVTAAVDEETRARLDALNILRRENIELERRERALRLAREAEDFGTDLGRRVATDGLTRQDATSQALELENQRIRALREESRRIADEYRGDQVAIARETQAATAVINASYAERVAALQDFATTGNIVKAGLLELEGAITEGLTDSIQNLVNGGSGAFQDFAKTVIDSIQRMIIQMLIVEPIVARLKASLAALNFAGVPIGLPTASASVPGLARGGPVSKGVPVIVGEDGPELLIPRSAGQVMSRNTAQSMLRQGGSSPVNVNVFNAPGTTAEVQQTPNGAGGFDIDVVIKAVSDGIARDIKAGRGLSSTLESKYNVKRASTVR